MLDVKTTLKTPAPVFKPEMLVSHADGSVGIVTQISRNYVHVLWLVNTNPVDQRNVLGPHPLLGKKLEGKVYCPSKWVYFDSYTNEGAHHFISFHKKKELTICPVGTTVTITQTEKA